MMPAMSETLSVSIDVAAPPEVVYRLVSDLPRMGEWSPENVGCRWLGGATGPEVGARFKGRNRRGWRRWSTTGTVVAAVPGREIAWDVTSVFGLPVARWGYRIEPSGDAASTVTETFEDRRGGVMHVLGRLASGVGDRPSHNEAGMRATLDKVKATAEAG